MLRGAALAEQGAVDEAIARIREGVTKWTRLGRTFLLPESSVSQPRGWSVHRDQAAALAACARVWRWQMSRASIFGMRNDTALPCIALLAENKLDEGPPSLQTQSTLRKPNKRKSLELRATASLARLWRDQGKPQQSSRTTRSGLRLVQRRCPTNAPI